MYFKNGIMGLNILLILLLKIIYVQIILINGAVLTSQTNVASVGSVFIFPDPPLLTPDEGPSLETSIFPLSFQVVREPLPFAVLTFKLQFYFSLIFICWFYGTAGSR